MRANSANNIIASTGHTPTLRMDVTFSTGRKKSAFIILLKNTAITINFGYRTFCTTYQHEQQLLPLLLRGEAETSQSHGNISPTAGEAIRISHTTNTYRNQPQLTGFTEFQRDRQIYEISDRPSLDTRPLEPSRERGNSDCCLRPAHTGIPIPKVK